MKSKVSFFNDFHNSQSVKVATIKDGIYVLSQAQIKKAAKECCGISGCTCGDFRGGIYNEEGIKLYWVDDSNPNCTNLTTERPMY